jgi:hypothetical protein
MNKGTSNEKSLMQNFSSAGKNLDTLFTEKKDVEALSLFTEEYISKINKTIKLPTRNIMSECCFIYFEIRSASLYPIQAIGM